MVKCNNRSNRSNLPKFAKPCRYYAILISRELGRFLVAWNDLRLTRVFSHYTLLFSGEICESGGGERGGGVGPPLTHSKENVYIGNNLLFLNYYLE